MLISTLKFKHAAAVNGASDHIGHYTRPGNVLLAYHSENTKCYFATQQDDASRAGLVTADPNF